MDFLKSLRKGNKNNSPEKSLNAKKGNVNTASLLDKTSSGKSDPTARLPDKVLRLIFEAVCPHSTDVSYDAYENANVGDGCMLCDLRDLSICTRVRKSWHKSAQEQL